MNYSVHSRLGVGLESLFPSSVVTSSELVMPGSPPPFGEEFDLVQNAVPKRQNEFSAGRRAAHQALRSLGIAAGPILCDGDRVPIWPPGVVGSISHSASIAVAAVAKRCDVAALGIDIEIDQKLSDDIARMICRPNEWSTRSALSELIGFDAAMLTFSAKEAFYKGYFPQYRRFLDFQDVTIRLVETSEFQVDVVKPSLSKGLQPPNSGRYIRLWGHVLCGVSVISPG